MVAVWISEDKVGVARFTFQLAFGYLRKLKNNKSQAREIVYGNR
jgi:hypothetical protein